MSRRIAPRPAAVAVGALLLFGCASLPAPQDRPLVQRGEQIATARCSACHDIGSRGASPVCTAPPLRALRGNWNAGSLDLRLARAPLTAHDGMLNQSLGPSDLEALAHYLEAVRAGRAPLSAATEHLPRKPAHGCIPAS